MRTGVYASDSRWKIGIYEDDFADVNIARCEGYTNPTDEVVAYGVKSSAVAITFHFEM